MRDNCDENSAVLCGIVAGSAEYSHMSHDRKMLGFPVEILRLSGTVDKLNINIDSELFEKSGIAEGDMAEIRGTLRTYNNHSGVGSRLVISVLADGVDKLTVGTAENAVSLTGTLCKKPTFRRTPMGREICDVMLAVNRRSGRADYLPCILWGEQARRAANLSVGDRIKITGRLQSRNYIKNIEGEATLRTAFEISAGEFEILL